MTEETTTKIKNRFTELGIDIDAADITHRLTDLTDRFKVPLTEAERSVVSYFLRETGATHADYYKSASGTSELTTVGSIASAEQWVNLRVVVTKLWNNDHEAIDQSGLIADETGQIKFTKWIASELPELVEGKTYWLCNLVTDVFNERFGVKFNKTSTIEEIDEVIKPGSAQSTRQETVTLTVDRITKEGRWINLSAKVVQLWDSEHEAIDQIGLIGDGTGVIKFVKWTKAELPPIEEGKCYSFTNIVTDEYEGVFSVTLNSTSGIEEIDEDIEVVEQIKEFTGAMVHIQDGSGLIRRCPECNAALRSGACATHGTVDGIHDLRIKAVLDDGVNMQEVLLNREVTEAITGITLDVAKEMAIESLDASVVADEMKRLLLGRYYTASGKAFSRNMLVDEICIVDDVQEDAQ